MIPVGRGLRDRMSVVPEVVRVDVGLRPARLPHGVEVRVCRIKPDEETPRAERGPGAIQIRLTIISHPHLPVPIRTECATVKSLQLQLLQLLQLCQLLQLRQLRQLRQLLLVAARPCACVTTAA